MSVDPVGPVPLTGGGLDRAAQHRRDSEWPARAWQRGRVVVVDRGRTLVHDAHPGPAGAGKPQLVLLTAADLAADAERWFLGVDHDDVPYFAVAGQLPDRPGARAATLRDVGESLPDRDATLFVSAVALANWHAAHPFSPTSGRPTTVGEAGWTRATDDGETIWPRTDPAVIVLVHDGVPGPGGRCLLGHNASWRGNADGIPRYSCLAGFVEPGESAEQTVVREVAEEVGVAVREVRYLASQPWPLPRSLMLGFVALADPRQAVHTDADEISDARWFTRTEIAAALDGRGEGFALPMSLSIANFLIRSWVDGRS